MNRTGDEVLHHKIFSGVKIYEEFLWQVDAN